MTALPLQLRRLANPGAATFRLTARWRGPALRARYERLARAQGLRGPAFLLSFDCDTEGDIAVVEEVHHRLRQAGILPAYAVPGSLLEQGADVYRRLHADGAEFLNHGYAQHCRYDPQARQYESSHFYDQLSRQQAERDIRDGHDAVVRVLGSSPAGFRTPHFGTFQSAGQLRWLHRLLRGLGYRYSSSTMPRVAFRAGPLPTTPTGLREIPVSGWWSDPSRVLDTWTFRFAPGRRVDEQDYAAEFAAHLRHLGSERPGVMNVYADPSQVADWPAFFELAGRAAPCAVRSFTELLDRAAR